jgi:hypothetical protein
MNQRGGGYSDTSVGRVGRWRSVAVAAVAAERAESRHAEADGQREPRSKNEPCERTMSAFA